MADSSTSAARVAPHADDAGESVPEIPSSGRPVSHAPVEGDSVTDNTDGSVEDNSVAGNSVVGNPLVDNLAEDNLATEIVHGVPETVEVSRHPDPSIGDSDLSLADIGRRRSHPVQWSVYAVGVLTAIILPYWLGRMMAVRQTDWLISHMPPVTVEGVALVSWMVTVVMFSGLGLAIVESSRWLWRIVFAVGLAVEQLIAGVGLLKFDFWNSTYVIYGEHAQFANAANVGIMAAGFAVTIYAILFVGLLVLIPKRSRLNVLTRSWSSFILFFVIEVLAYLVVVFSGLLYVF